VAKETSFSSANPMHKEQAITLLGKVSGCVHTSPREGKIQTEYVGRERADEAKWKRVRYRVKKRTQKKRHREEKGKVFGCANLQPQSKDASTNGVG